MERIVTIPSGGLVLHGILYVPASERRTRLVVVCDPFAEEKKCAQRPLVDVSRALCASGYTVLRFDYRGCGDSEGEFGDWTLVDWCADIEAALQWARQQVAPHWTALAGLRLGAALAAQVAATRGDVQALVLWEPITDGKRYVTQNLRRSMIKAMLTEGDQFRPQAVALRHEADLVDFDGYAVTARMRAELESVQLAAHTHFAGDVLVLGIGVREEPAQWVEALASAFPRGQARGIRLEPFWNRIGLIAVEPMIEATLDWFASIDPDPTRPA